MNDVIGSADLIKILKTYISAVSRTAVGLSVALQYDRLIINQMDTYIYEVVLPINTGFSLGLNDDTINLILSAKPSENFSSVCGLHPQMFHNPLIVDYLVGKIGWYNETAKSLYCSVSINDLSDHEDFQMKTNKLRADDGCRFVHFQGQQLYERYLIPVFAGFPNLTKMDTMGINIYPYDNTTYIGEYFIRKKKIKAEYHCFARHKNMDRSLRWEITG